MKIRLSKPPSVNTLYRATARRGFVQHYISSAGKAWFTEAGYLIKQAMKRKAPIKGEVEVEVDLYTCRHQDLDNIMKATMDLLQKAGVVEDDAQIVSLLLHKYKVKHVKEEGLEIELFEL